MIFEIHPHEGFLNTKYQLRTDSANSINVHVKRVGNENGKADDLVYEKDLICSVADGIKFDVSGKYEVSVKSDMDDAVHTVIVKDAIMFGGGSFKKAYVFDETPWCFIVMKDRTYFYNRETKESFVESISPDNIEIVSSDVVMLSNNQRVKEDDRITDYTLFSLKCMLPILSVSKVLYLSSSNVISEIKYGDRITIKHYTYSLDLTLEERQEDCEAYSVDKEHGVIYLFKGRWISKYALDTFEMEKSNYVGEDFVEFVQAHYYVSLAEGRNVRVQDADSRQVISDVKFDCAVLSVCNKDLGSQYVNDIIQNTVKHKKDNGINVSWAIEYVSIRSIVVIDGSAFYLYDHNVVSAEWRLKQSKSYVRKDDAIIYEANRIDGSLMQIDNTPCIKDDRGTMYFFNKNGKPEAKALYSYGSVHLIRKDDGLYDVKGCCVLKGDFKLSYFEEYGLIIDERNLTFRRVVNGSITDAKPYTGSWRRNIYNVWRRECGDEGYYYRDTLTCNGKVVFLEGVYVSKSNTQENLMSICPNNGWGIAVRGEELSIVKYTDEDHYEPERILNDEYDSAHFENVLFSEDGSFFVSSLDGHSVMVDTRTGEQTEFEQCSYVSHYNGYRPMLLKDNFRKAKLVDPLTNNIIDEAHLNEYRFMSPDGKLYAKTSLAEYTRYYNRAEKKYITKEELQLFKEKYDFPYGCTKEQKNEISKIRAVYIESHRDFFEKRSAMDMDRFSVMVIYDEGYARICRTIDDSTYREFKIGTPLQFVNYVAFSNDGRYVAIAGRSSSSGEFILYDMQEQKEMNPKFDERYILAVWTASFSIKGQYALYTSSPDTYIGNVEDESDLTKIEGKSFLTFSPDGTWVALSEQGYIPYGVKRIDGIWGHRPSCVVDIRKSSSPETQITQYDDLSDDGIADACKGKTVASISFSKDNKKIMMVGKDGVVIIRNLHLDR